MGGFRGCESCLELPLCGGQQSYMRMGCGTPGKTRLSGKRYLIWRGSYPIIPGLPLDSSGPRPGLSQPFHQYAVHASNGVNLHRIHPCPSNIIVKMHTHALRVAQDGGEGREGWGACFRDSKGSVDSLWERFGMPAVEFLHECSVEEGFCSIGVRHRKRREVNAIHVT